MSSIISNIIWPCLLIVCSCSCNSPKEAESESKKEQNATHIMITERFNIKAYEKRESEEATEFTEDDGTIVQQFEVGEGNEVNYIEYRTPQPPGMFKSFKRYHNDGTLKIEGKKFHSDFNYGVWKTYNFNGGLIEEKDYEAPYNLSFEEFLVTVRAYHKEMDIPEVDILHNRTTITRQETDDGNIWSFSWQAIPGRIELLKFSDETGELISVSYYELTGS